MKKFYFYLKLLMILNCFLLSACQNLNRPAQKLDSPYKINADLSGWRLTDSKIDSIGSYSQLYEPVNQGITVKEKIDVVYIKNGHMPLNQFFQEGLDAEKEMCNSSHREIILKDENTISSYSKMSECHTPSFHKEMEKFEKGFNQPDGFYAIRYLVLSDKISPEKIAHMKQVVVSANLLKNTP